MGISKSKSYGNQSNDTVKRTETVDLSTFRARVDSVNISGLQRTHDDYIIRAISPIFETRTFADLLTTATEAKSNLDELGCFKDDVRVTVTVAPKDTAKTTDSYIVSFTGTERRRITGGISTEIGNNEGAVNTEISAPNIWGRGERFTVTGSYGNMKTTDVNLIFSKPFYHTHFGDLKPMLSVSAFRHAAHQICSQFKSQNIGGLIDFSFYRPKEFKHTLQLETAIRDTEPLGKHQVPFFVREHFGPHLATIFRYILTFDQRDNIVFPTRGMHVWMKNEMAGLVGGDCNYLMNESHFEMNVPITNGITAQWCCRFGVIKNDRRHSPRIPISSKFFVGGPFTVRGYQTGGIGEHKDHAAVGEETYWLSGLHLWTHLPFSHHFGSFGNRFRCHLFYNVGNREFSTLNNLCSTAGIGLAFNIFSRARIECNYCVPLTNKNLEYFTQNGFVFGIGCDFV